MTEDAKKKRGRLREAVAFEGAGSLFHAEIDPAPHGVLLRVTGVCRVICLSPDRVGLQTRRGTLFVSGIGISLSVFEDQAVGVTGHVEEIQLQYGKH